MSTIKNRLGENPRHSKQPLKPKPNPAIEYPILMRSSYTIADVELDRVVWLLHCLICRHKGHQIHQITGGHAMLAYPMYWLDKYCTQVWENDKTVKFTIDSLAPEVHAAWSKIYQEELKKNAGKPEKYPFTKERNADSLKKYEELSDKAKVFNKLYAYLYFLLLDEYAKKHYPDQKFNLVE